MKSNLIAIQTSGSLAHRQQRLDNFSALDITFLTILSLGIILSIFIPICDFISKQKQQSRAHNPKLPTNPICPGCQYFSNNCYLGCALQPTIVMTKESIDCQDYLPVHKAK